MIEDLRKTAQAYEIIADVYDRENSDRSHILPDIKRFQKYMPRGSRLLDLGCGVGFDARDFHNIRPDIRIMGIDVSFEMLKRFEQNAQKIEHSRANILTYPYPPQTYDGVWMNASFHHIPKDVAGSFLDKVSFTLRKDGTLYLRIKEGSGESMVPATNYGHEEIERFFSFYTRGEIEKLMLLHQFNIKKWGKRRVGESKWISVIATKT